MYGDPNSGLSVNQPTRPSTAIGRVIEKLSNGSAFSALGTSFGSDRSISGAQSPIMAYSLQVKLGRIIKLEEKSKLIKLELAQDFESWSKIVTNNDMSNMLSEFSGLLLQVTNCSGSITEKLEVLKLNLADVHEREKKRKALVHTKSKLVKQLRESESKFGVDSSGSLLLKEDLEESNCTLEVVEMQYMRAINRNLKEALVEYVATLQIVSGEIKEATDTFYEILLKLEEKHLLLEKKFSLPINKLQILQIQQHHHQNLAKKNSHKLVMEDPRTEKEISFKSKDSSISVPNSTTGINKLEQEQDEEELAKRASQTPFVPDRYDNEIWG